MNKGLVCLWKIIIATMISNYETERYHCNGWLAEKGGTGAP